RLAAGNGDFNGGNLADQSFGFRCQARLAEVAADALAKVAGFTHVEDAAGIVIHAIDTGAFCQLFQEILAVELPGRLLGVRPCRHPAIQALLPSAPVPHHWKSPAFRKSGSGNCSRFSGSGTACRRYPEPSGNPPPSWQSAFRAQTDARITTARRLHPAHPRAVSTPFSGQFRG